MSAREMGLPPANPGILVPPDVLMSPESSDGMKVPRAVTVPRAFGYQTPAPVGVSTFGVWPSGASSASMASDFPGSQQQIGSAGTLKMRLSGVIKLIAPDKRILRTKSQDFPKSQQLLAARPDFGFVYLQQLPLPPALELRLFLVVARQLVLPQSGGVGVEVPDDL